MLTCVGQVAAHSHATAAVAAGLVAAARVQAGQGVAVLHVRLAPLGLQQHNSSSSSMTKALSGRPLSRQKCQQSCAMLGKQKSVL
jgi:predicted DNA repair protein MutK